jgi:hypothetical protein
MEFRLDIRGTGNTFAVHLLDRDNTPLTDPSGTPLTRPIIPLDAEAEKVFGRIVEQKPKNDDMASFGQRLFDMLIGIDWWNRIVAEKGPIELAVICDRFAGFNRLPWEMMNVPPKGPFLAQVPQCGIVRRISGTSAVFTPIPSPPTVLIAVGAELHHDVIRPAAECLALLNNLKDANRGIRLRTHLLLNASPNRLRTAVKHFKPQVVHLICHGEVDPEKRRGALILAGDSGGGKTVTAFSETVLDALSRTEEGQPEAILPSIVVLSACYTAAASMADIGQIATPLAQEIATKVPLVVGMSGAITDQPCRLFARRFYESLLADGDVAQAASEGRRAALTDAGTDPKSTVDWTMPVVCLSGAVTSTRVPIEQPSPEAVAWETFASDFVTRPDIVFCDRVEIMNVYNLLMASPDAQRAIRPEKTDLQVLAIVADAERPERKYGRTRVLRELAAKAAIDGHVPVLIETVVNQWPKTRQVLLKTLANVCANTAQRFKVFDPVCQNLNTLLRAGRTIPDSVDAQIRSAFPSSQYESDDPAVLAFALRLDLLALLNAIKIKRPAAERDGARVLLLIDDVHKMDAAAIDLASVLLEAGGARGASSEIRVILTYATVQGGPAPGDDSAIDALKGLTDKPWVAIATLGRFRQPDEDRHAYERFLLHWSDQQYNGLAIRSDSPDFTNYFWEEAEEDIGGVPSLLTTIGPRLVRRFLRLPAQGQILRPANDDDLLRQASLIRREG